ncbi:MAG: hypothetical protein IT190_09255 [Microbacteriaceae bacterium]|nr:hypothetical protein [Microbacteriaceae bacterium]
MKRLFLFFLLLSGTALAHERIPVYSIGVKLDLETSSHAGAVRVRGALRESNDRFGLCHYLEHFSVTISGNEIPRPLEGLRLVRSPRLEQLRVYEVAESVPRLLAIDIPFGDSSPVWGEAGLADQSTLVIEVDEKTRKAVRVVANEFVSAGAPRRRVVLWGENAPAWR